MAFIRGFPTRGFPGRGWPAGWSQGTAVANSWWPSGPSGPAYTRIFAETTPGGSVEEFDLATYGIYGLKLNVSDKSPARFEFSMNAAQHTTPIPMRSAIWLVDESYGYFPEKPVFFGHVDNVAPVGSLELRYTCFDPLKRAGHECFAMSLPWQKVDGRAVETVGSVPHIVFNVKVDQDEEAAWQRLQDATCGELIETLLDDAKEYLNTIGAAPTGGDDPYNAGVLSGLDYKPQDKIVFANATTPQCVANMLALDPKYRMVFDPETRQWTFYDSTAADDVTLTLNDYSTHFVMSLNLGRIAERRYSAVKIYGPYKAVNALFSTADATLTEGWGGIQQSFFQTGGPDAANVGNAGKVWQITDATRRSLASRMPSEQLIPAPDSFGIAALRTRKPTVVATFDAGDTWEIVGEAKIDTINGTITVPNAVYRFDDSASPAYSLPDELRFYAAFYDQPITVRYPTSGFSGTMSSVIGADVEAKFYDPSLAIGWENGVPVAEATRTAQYQKLAQKIHEAISALAHVGGFTLAGIDYEWLRLQKRVNFAAVNANGGSLTTGWESINAIVTDVEYDYEANGITTVTLSSDLLEFLESDPEAIKLRLKIDAQQWSRDYGPAVTLNFGRGAFSTFFVGKGSDSEEVEILTADENERKRIADEIDRHTAKGGSA